MNTKVFVFKCVSLNASSFIYASKLCRADKTIILKAMEDNHCIFEYANDDIKNDINFIKKSMKFS